MHVILRHRHIVLLVAAFATLLALAYVVLRPPAYKSTARLLVNFSQKFEPAIANSGQSSTSTPLDRTEIINSYVLQFAANDLARNVVQAVGIDKLYPRLAGKGLLGFTAPSDPNEAIEKAVDKLSRDLDVTVERSSNVITMSLSNADRDVAGEAAEKVIRLFLEKEVRIRRDPQLAFVRDQADFYRKAVTSAQDKMRSFQLDNNISSMDEERTALIQQRALQEHDLSLTRTRIVEDNRKISELGSQLAALNPVSELMQEDRDPLVESLRTDLASQETKQAKSATIYAADSPVMKEQARQIDTMRALLAKTDRLELRRTENNPTYNQIQVALIEAKADLEAATQSGRAQESELAALNAKLAHRDKIESVFQNLVREYQISDQNYRVYLQSIQEARIADDLNKHSISSIALIDPPYTPIKPSQLNAILVIVLAGIFGLLAGAVIAFAIEATDQTFSTSWQVRELIGVPVIGYLPDLDPEAQLTGLKGLRKALFQLLGRR